MKPLLILSCVASSLVVSACMVREERVVQPAPATAAVVAPAPSAVVYTDPAPKTTTTTVYTR
ncbi:hypothetical protein [Reyranella soli]|jgi:hypothetical protein|uniref:Lipoprotein n=1 Tax=Reyranella soli TaxID=1230389 RepID=A0A512NFH4_9HYPH|nr:hypothetical protein [Reyranella soli]GEP57700.1 hypothetical protein RSO01_48660 [Reyranella soli]